MTTLLAGGAGFIGPHLAHRLLAEGRRVEIVDDLSRGRLGRIATLRGQPGLRFHRLDIRSGELTSLVARRQPVEVVHLAASLPSAHRSGAELVAEAERAWLSLVALLEAVRTVEDVRVVVAGTAETSTTGGSVAAALARAQADTVRSAAESGLDVVCVALPAVYGPGEPDDAGASPVARLLRSVGARGASGGGDGDDSGGDAPDPTVELDDPVGDLLYVDDAVDALSRALGPAPLAGTVVPLGSGRPVGVLELVDLIAAVVGRRPVTRRRARFVGTVDGTVARRVLGWSAFTPLAEGVRLTARDGA